MRTLPLLALLAGCLLERNPPCATGYSRNAEGECVEVTATKVKPTETCGNVAFTLADFGCEGENVVFLGDVSCLTTGRSTVDVFDSLGGTHEAHDLTQWAVDPAGTWEQLESVLVPTGLYQPNSTTALDCYSFGEPAITAVVRTRGLSDELVDCALVSNDPAGPASVFDGTAGGFDQVELPAELTASNCDQLPKP